MAFYQKHFAEFKSCAPLQTLLLFSDYACRQIELLKQVVLTDYQTPLGLQDYSRLLEQIDDQPFSLFARALRQFRHTQFLRLLLRELSGLGTTEDTMRAWSDFADAIVLRAIRFCEKEVATRYGYPCDEQGKPTKLYILAMGKLGGRELNYSSDIDLICAFSTAGYTNGSEQIANQQYYTKVVQLFIQLLQNITAEGFVFRVDLRLRPNGDSGALVSSLAAMETYYQEQGRDWERYAMVKARLIGENTENPNHWFHRLITPFVYRRYVDFSVIESLRSMKAMIEREVQLNPMLDDIKRGFGGIREVEFIIQNMQLIRGGRIPDLQTQNTIAALKVLKQEGLLSHTAALRQAYFFLRKLENVLQSQNDQQTHSLPQDELKQAQIAFAMGYTWQELLNKLHQYQRIISAIFRAVLAKVEPYEDEKRLLTNQLMSLWQGHVETTMAINLLASLGFQRAERCYQMINAFRHAPRCRRLSQAARMRLDRFMLLLLSELVHVVDTDRVLLQVLQLLENIVGRSPYLALITENPQVLKELLYWFAHSRFITSLIVNQPFLLEVLLEQEKNWHLPSRKELEYSLENRLSHCVDGEQKEEILRQFKLVNWLSAARAEIYGRYHATRISGFLADVAEVIVTKVLALACEQLAPRYPQMTKIKSHFAILAYGKLGSREMNYTSDLDLVFIHATDPEEEALVTRLTQKILHMLTTRSQAGILYSVDTRLRPSGEAGLLVSHIDAFVEYQLRHAWTWEHQALIRTRVLVGDKYTGQTFKQLKKAIFQIPRNLTLIRDEVLAMRKKIYKHANGDEIKHKPGGLIDLEFLVQYLVLTHPYESFSRYTNTLSLLRKLFAERIIDKEQFEKLVKAYKHYHQLLHQNLLKSEEVSTAKTLQNNVIEVAEQIYKV
ncbi:bifunctional [glutamate--ammonia ligase]-adenylyl-L-tyrosine phosphorylase/[glutamate--ammonia-ligase] adenylyltransferase [Legionella cardiaca]|uniref:Bifunctional [glutamate--ammonia ligase]-adenylyl-L-tyrosine phosphorylase/[glutamate--ammonia-ligase] adenylyltransferase n=1 Tax=Legionella cardiaca TaxID=1071983 RepID=A0ABY8AVB9_9GAMM|nr:bifunctional [glutamate--ammonia ligase]-adenylyl-L-tyrosine phosphorylase/[glutamate--ammonia-ligase] adenylyltransferase [Legionella cardiaca]WED44630.1 bifunctional [glutamate--ammonia ligase]-adenylyl-L-tyrosine phosphorylase/[glutamate--ammonia-ligase] adenylyltransferase [Legionella cardiaca]